MQWNGPDLAAWEPWTPQRLTEILTGAPACWCIVGGWAIDLWLGRRTRPHGDMEIAAPRTQFAQLRGFFEPKYRLHAAGDGETVALGPGEPMPASRHQCWISDPAAGKWRLDLMLEPGDQRDWVYRRDERIAEPRAAMVGHAGSIPFLVPQAVLLYKAKACRDKDQADLEACLPRLSAPARAWLANALATTHPGHLWIERCRNASP